MKVVTSIVLLAGLSLFDVACLQSHHTAQMNTAPGVPAATGNAKIAKDSNGNTTVDLRVKHLADPQKLTPPENVYVVWIQPRGEQAKNMGALTVNKDLSANFHAVTPYKDFDLFVTAENNATAATPTGTQVMTQHVSR